MYFRKLGLNSLNAVLWIGVFLVSSIKLSIAIWNVFFFEIINEIIYLIVSRVCLSKTCFVRFIWLR